MKINPGSSSRRDQISSDKKSRKKNSGSVGNLFRRLFSSQSVSVENESHPSFQAEIYLEEIDALGSELLQSRSMGAMERYRAKVKEILEQFSKSHENQGVDAVSLQSGKHQKLYLVKEINQKLVELTHQVIGKQKDSPFLKEAPVSEDDKYKAVPTLVDSIKGLLIDFIR